MEWVLCFKAGVENPHPAPLGNSFPTGVKHLGSTLQSDCLLWDLPRALQLGVTLCRIRATSSAGNAAHPTGAVSRDLTAEPELLQLGYL